MSKYKNYILLAFIIFLGLFLRVYNINNAPPGIYPDEAVNGIDALEANDTRNYQWFYPANQGREGLMMNLVALCFSFFGVSALTLKLPSIIFGTLTILGTYLLGKELFKSERIGLISSFLVATSFWAINFSRISFRANMLPVILAFSFYFLAKGLWTKKWTDFSIGGLIFGFGLHTYIAFRIAPLILIVVFIALVFNKKHFLKEYWKQTLFFILFFFISASPMFYTFFISHPEFLESRSSSISIFSEEVNQGHFFKTLFKSFSLSLLKYNFWGDQNWRHNYPPYPLLDPLTGLAFLFGLLYSIFKFFHLAVLRFSKNVRDEKIKVYLLLITSFFFMLAPEFLTAEGNPHALRAIGTLPFVFIFSAFSFNYFLEYSQKKLPVFGKTASIFLAAILIFIGFFNPIKYFFFWANKPETAKSFEKNITELSLYAKTLPKDAEIYAVLGNMQRVPARMFNWNNKNFHDISPWDLDNIKMKNKKIIFIFTDFEKEMIASKILARFPNLHFQEIKDNIGLSYYIFK